MLVVLEIAFAVIIANPTRLDISQSGSCYQKKSKTFQKNIQL